MPHIPPWNNLCTLSISHSTYSLFCSSACQPTWILISTQTLPHIFHMQICYHAFTGIPFHRSSRNPRSSCNFPRYLLTKQFVPILPYSKLLSIILGTKRRQESTENTKSSFELAVITFCSLNYDSSHNYHIYFWICLIWCLSKFLISFNVYLYHL